MKTDPDVAKVAAAMIKSFGEHAAAIMERRARNHVRSGEHEGAQFWHRVAREIRQMERGPCSDDPGANADRACTAPSRIEGERG
jgi:hypothetical protein